MNEIQKAAYAELARKISEQIAREKATNPASDSNGAEPSRERSRTPRLERDRELDLER